MWYVDVVITSRIKMFNGAYNAMSWKGGKLGLLIRCVFELTSMLNHS